MLPGATWSVSGDQLTFTVDASNLGSEFTLGAQDSPTAFDARPVSRNGIPTYALAGAVSAVVLGGVALAMRRQRAHGAPE
ncbi:MAG: hypothetical protein ACE5GO_08230 [Anaerolineales bacterium]